MTDSSGNVTFVTVNSKPCAPSKDVNVPVGDFEFGGSRFKLHVQFLAIETDRLRGSKQFKQYE